MFADSCTFPNTKSWKKEVKGFYYCCYHLHTAQATQNANKRADVEKQENYIGTNDFRITFVVLQTVHGVCGTL